jgi:hypothetical protein
MHQRNEQQPRIHVDCYAGHRADEEPRRFLLGKREIEIEEVIDRWLDPGHRYFKVRGSDGSIYLLRHEPGQDAWELVMYDSGKRDDTRLSST